MKIQFICLASGSSGNCYYLGTETYGILIDAGIPARKIKQDLKDVGIGFEKVMAVFVTHDHADHIKSLGTLGERCSIPIFATRETHIGINRNYCTTQKLVSCMRYVEKDTPLHFRDFTITPFEVPHDATDTVGYCIQIYGKTFCFVTDIGHITESVSSYIDSANYLIIEANYDKEMLASGPYPPYLKERIAGPNGHLCNAETASFLAEHLSPRTSHVWLCHLSQENNHPELAYKTVEYVLRKVGIVAGVDFHLAALKRTMPSELFEIEVEPDNVNEGEKEINS
ncbi:MAG: MBL fold metallo-hydrolase [Bacteroidaceae bacterium]|nr:MBL fold metallo-hydrolase [Bacteroidaceae bacterium]MBO4590919.1 MBL fold metallo-hydrolase [Bacteroidaceae bacterium]MBR5963778.1 MBL fold metallo-hydrolase [Bacteroidaceae bacterium]